MITPLRGRECTGQQRGSTRLPTEARSRCCERQGATEQEVGGRGLPRNERERVMAAQAGGGWRAIHEKKILQW